MKSLALDIKKTLCIQQLTEELPVLRARLGLSQEEVAERIGMTRQSYNAIESGRRPMLWSTCISLVTLFACHRKTRAMMEASSYCVEILNEVMCGC
ncbi:MAG: helix-turn-helix domain-containing protein [Clostridia bacterium]|nr:helix-turn-helix domain-containing protein [Clostridia bacterium]